MLYDRAWHVVTSRIALPASATAEDSFGTLASESQYLPQAQGASTEVEFSEALRLLVNARSDLPRAAHTEDILFWHTQQVRKHFAQHVLPLLSACADEQLGGQDLAEDAERGSYEKHMIIIMSSIRTLEAALRLYSYGLQLLVRGIKRFQTADQENVSADQQLITARFRRDVHALVSNSASPQLTRSLRIVLIHLIGNTLGLPAQNHQVKVDAVKTRPAPPNENDLNSLAARQRLLELLEPLYSVGLAGEKFQILFAEVMDGMMCDFVKRAYAGVWAAQSEQHGLLKPKRTASITGLQATKPGSSSPCVASLCDWVENHYARLAIEVLSRIVDDSRQPPVTLSDVKTYQALALGRLAALRISELFDIVLAWPSSRGALDDLRASITTPARRLQLTDSFTAALHRRLLHPGRSTLEILETYIAMIRTFHALDHSKVLLGRVSPSLQLYLCGREDAVRIVVTGLLASPEEIRAARREKQAREEKEAVARGQTKGAQGGPFMTPALSSRRGARSRHGTPDVEEIGIMDRPEEPPTKGTTHTNKLVELALLLTDPAQSRRAGGVEDDADLDWNDMSWVPDPIDAGANYKRPRSEDVIGTLISALGSQDTFIREFQVIVAERLLSDQARFEQEVRVLNLLKKRFGEAALQNCDVMIRDIQDSRRFDGAIRKVQGLKDEEPQTKATLLAATPTNPRTRARDVPAAAASPEVPYHARILSRLFWPNLEREHFLLPTPIAEHQKDYEQGYQHLKSARKLTWLNQLGQATVELELQDRTVSVDCKTYEATVIYAFQEPDSSPGPARRTVQDLVDELQMDDELVTSALAFWVSKGVLARKGADTYVVLETAASSSSDPTAAITSSSAPGSPVAGSAAPPAAPTAAVIDEKEAARRTVYWQYIRGMLTNASATMPLGQMAMMMKMLITDGFKWSNEELQEFLGEKVADGEMEIVGGKYRLVRK
jgi:anaphase-promoting complex subunit 2